MNLPDEFSSALFPDLKHLVVYDPEDAEKTRCLQLGFMKWGGLVGRGEGMIDEDLDARAKTLEPDDPINIQFTSGTTGFPKAVVLTHHNILNNAYFAAKIMRMGVDDRLCVAVPFYHCFGMVVANLVCIMVGVTIVIPSEYFEATLTLAAIDKESCTAVHGVPTMFIAELEHPDFHLFDHSSLRTRIMAGPPCPPELVRRVMEDMGCKEILIGYGQLVEKPFSPFEQNRIMSEKGPWISPFSFEMRGREFCSIASKGGKPCIAFWMKVLTMSLA